MLVRRVEQLLKDFFRFLVSQIGFHFTKLLHQVLPVFANEQNRAVELVEISKELLGT